MQFSETSASNSFASEEAGLIILLKVIPALRPRGFAAAAAGADTNTNNPFFLQIAGST